MKLTLRARIGITRMINDQRGSMDDAEVWSDLKSKILVPEDAFKDFSKDLGNGQSIVDNAGIEAKLDEPGEDFHFEKAERRKLFETMKTWRGFMADDSRWNREVAAQLDESLKEVPIEVSKVRKKA